jgi:hypothetical protein
LPDCKKTCNDLTACNPQGPNCGGTFGSGLCNTLACDPSCWRCVGTQATFSAAFCAG